MWEEQGWIVLHTSRDHSSSIFSLKNGLVGLPLRIAFSLVPHHTGHSNSPGECLQIFPLCPKGNSQTALHCAHRTNTVSSCGFCEQEGWSGCSPPIPETRRPAVESGSPRPLTQ